jgi:hypothetical protein
MKKAYRYSKLKSRVMKRVFMILATMVQVLGFVISTTHAEFINNGGGMIYDTNLNITWLQNANYAKSSGYDSDGLMTFNQASSWAASLIYGGIGGWRLPTFDPANPRPATATSANEIGSLLMTLTNGRFDLSLPTYTMADISPFYNLPHLLNSENREVYWTGLAGRPGLAWEYYMH